MFRNDITGVLPDFIEWHPNGGTQSDGGNRLLFETALYLAHLVGDLPTAIDVAFCSSA